jgi:hypothetical protein
VRLAVLSQIKSVKLLAKHQESSPSRRTDALQALTNIGIEPSLERERPAVNNRMRLVQDHVAGLHANVGRSSVMADHF